MNVRIKPLAEKARHWAHFKGLEQNPTSSPDSLFEAKFAELIVRECILTIQMGITRDGPDTEKYLRSMKHIKQIKEHFGVEE